MEYYSIIYNQRYAKMIKTLGGIVILIMIKLIVYRSYRWISARLQ